MKRMITLGFCVLLGTTSCQNGQGFLATVKDVAGEVSGTAERQRQEDARKQEEENRKQRGEEAEQALVDFRDGKITEEQCGEKLEQLKLRLEYTAKFREVAHQRHIVNIEEAKKKKEKDAHDACMARLRAVHEKKQKSIEQADALLKDEGKKFPFSEQFTKPQKVYQQFESGMSLKWVRAVLTKEGWGFAEAKSLDEWDISSAISQEHSKQKPKLSEMLSGFSGSKAEMDSEKEKLLNSLPSKIAVTAKTQTGNLTCLVLRQEEKEASNVVLGFGEVVPGQSPVLFSVIVELPSGTEYKAVLDKYRTLMPDAKVAHTEKKETEKSSPWENAQENRKFENVGYNMTDELENDVLSVEINSVSIAVKLYWRKDFSSAWNLVLERNAAGEIKKGNNLTSEGERVFSDFHVMALPDFRNQERITVNINDVAIKKALKDTQAKLANDAQQKAAEEKKKKDAAALDF